MTKPNQRNNGLGCFSGALAKGPGARGRGWPGHRLTLCPVATSWEDGYQTTEAVLVSASWGLAALTSQCSLGVGGWGGQLFLHLGSREDSWGARPPPRGDNRSKGLGINKGKMEHQEGGGEGGGRRREKRKGGERKGGGGKGGGGKGGRETEIGTERHQREKRGERGWLWDQGGKGHERKGLSAQDQAGQGVRGQGRGLEPKRQMQERKRVGPESGPGQARPG